ncbi:hypothetical protein [Dethiothermospora halolimnae]|uniref:hypothetical protein n=1 Tax=Dethiothermospora halolimnae TaxID=3114390 RepID=UPI003CCC3EAF
MVNTSFFMGILGLVIFIIIVTTFQKLLKNNESGFLHLLMCFMFLCWLPVPLVVYIELKAYSFLFIGALLGTVSLILYIIKMILQASHLSYSARASNNDKELWREKNEWMLNGLLGSQVELLAGFLKGIWTIFLTIVFWLNGQMIFSALGIIYSLFTIIYLLKLLDTSLIKELKILKVLSINTLIINLETSSWFLILLIWLKIN